jgi:UDP-glucose 4-epimerase
MRVFITGGAGFIGSHLCESLIKQGDKVVILDNFSTGQNSNIAQIQNKIEIHEGDIRDANLVGKLTKESDVVLHMAAALGVNTILEKTVESISTNFTGSEVVINAALKHEKRIIIASTSEIYGKNPKQPLTETSDRVVGPPQKIRWTYADAKALEEAIAHSLFLTEGLKVSTIRFFNTVGPRQIGRYGMVLPRFVEAAINGHPLKIYGDGTQSRVFCHVQDATGAVLKMIKRDETIGEVYNIGGEGEITIKQLAEKIIELTNSNSEITYTEYEDAYPIGFEDMQRRVPDISKAKSALDWAPTRDIDQIVKDVAVSYTASPR